MTIVVVDLKNEILYSDTLITLRRVWSGKILDKYKKTKIKRNNKITMSFAGGFKNSELDNFLKNFTLQNKPLKKLSYSCDILIKNNHTGELSIYIYDYLRIKDIKTIKDFILYLTSDKAFLKEKINLKKLSKEYYVMGSGKDAFESLLHKTNNIEYSVKNTYKESKSCNNIIDVTKISNNFLYEDIY